MTTVLTRASQAYPAGAYSFPVTGLPVGLVHFRASFTRDTWVALGAVALVTITRPDGVAVSMSLSGENLGLNKQGLPYTTVSLGVDKPAGITSMQIDVQVLQAIITAITVDAS